MSDKQEYVLGEHAAELARLGLQHRAWRAHALDLWRRGGLRAGARVLDFGCGPGFAALDLAEIAGSGGRVQAVDRSQAFLSHLQREAAARGITSITTREADVANPALLLDQVDFAWARWIFAFVPNLDAALDTFTAAIAPGGVAAVQEYIEYAAWRLLPEEPAVTMFLGRVMQSWRARGGEPNIAAAVLDGLIRRGFEILDVRPICEAATPQDPLWDWPESFVLGNVPRLVQLGDLQPAEGDAIVKAWEAARARPGVRMLAPLTGQILARKPA